ncbi:MAG: hypothetical protein QNI87_09735 [Erythrobacter sp.]|uniref:hypothetical protein n=1 Tax=Erythrobacter sp. TaxID=1042 RepID=UPI002609EEC1|nr:hypothetical protein [Erythrobacter sp.]MDJ0978807.1 hypothetical protein [Erythrobacter sp.]
MPSAAPEPAPDHAEASKTWYVMLAIYEPYDPERCKKPVYKVSTYDPIIFDGPSAISQAHANAVVGAWLGYLRDRSPTAYKWINGPTGNHVNEIYFRESEEEARQAFASDGHMKRDTNCTGSVLYRQGTSKFRFVPSDAFKRADFGAEPRPTEPTAAPAKEIAAARAEP